MSMVEVFDKQQSTGACEVVVRMFIFLIVVWMLGLWNVELFF